MSKILVVDDNPVNCDLLSRRLMRAGYTVLVAKNGDEALRLCEKHRGPVHLMITDVVMPGMSGGKLSERIAVTRPETKVLYMSGYTDNTIVHHGVLDPETSFLQKPFTLHAFLYKVREVLEKE